MSRWWWLVQLVLLVLAVVGTVGLWAPMLAVSSFSGAGLLATFLWIVFLLSLWAPEAWS